MGREGPRPCIEDLTSARQGALDSGGDPEKWPDPTGANAGYWATPSPGPADAPVGDDDPAAMTPPKLYDRIVHNLFSINMVWTLVTGFLVMFMQAGFASVETGLCRAKNAAHVMANLRACGELSR